MSSSSENLKIEARGLVKSFGAVVAVDHVSFDVEKGEVIGLLGPSGCGKTTVLRALAGLEEITEGEIVLDGKLMASTTKHVMVPPEKRRLGLVFQSYALWPHMTVHDNIAYSLHSRKLPKQMREKKIQEVLGLVGLPDLGKRYPSQLSGGQQQRIALARSLSYEPDIILLDEPLSNLDMKVRERMRGELRSLLKRLGLTAVFVTHDQEEAFVISDRILLMNKGAVVQEGGSEELYSHPSSPFVAEFIGRANILNASVLETWEEGRKARFKVPELRGELVCERPEGIPRDSTQLAIRYNELSCSRHATGKENEFPGKVLAREYRGSVTDHRIQVGEAVLVVTTHKFCGSSESPTSSDIYVQIPPAAITPVARRT
jgi:iron(III) transport system ATP-binding protein